jgi:hypothetical protein
VPIGVRACNCDLSHSTGLLPPMRFVMLTYCCLVVGRSCCCFRWAVSAVTL